MINYFNGPRHLSLKVLSALTVASMVLSACGGSSSSSSPALDGSTSSTTSGTTPTTSSSSSSSTSGPTTVAATTAAAVTAALQGDIKNVVVIYAENRSFDNLFGNFPGADGLPGLSLTSSGTQASTTQMDRNGTPLATLPNIWSGLTVSFGDGTQQYDQPAQYLAQSNSAGMANQPFLLNSTAAYSNNQTPTTPVTASTVTRDLVHRFFNNQMQIDGGKNDMFVAYADSGALAMGYYDASNTNLYKLAQKYTLADNFFQGAFGGSFLNHQYLICACAPVYQPQLDANGSAQNDVTVKASVSAVNTDANGNFLPQLTPASTMPASALSGPPTYQLDGALTPKNYAGDGNYYAVNTMQPPYQPSFTSYASGGNPLLADYANVKATLNPQTAATIGDTLDAQKVSWAWFSGAWNQTVATATSTNRAGLSASLTTGNATATPPVPATHLLDNPNFQFHHQPFNYYAKLDPVNAATYRSAHLKDYTDLLTAAQNGTLPQVSFYKPEGTYNMHPGYTNIQLADQKISSVVSALQASPQWPHMAIIITYDEFGGQYDHKAPPKGDLWGPGTRIPAIVISPYAKQGYVDHTQYDTGSIIRFLTRLYNLQALPGITQRDTALVKNGGKAMGDLTNAFNL